MWLSFGSEPCISMLQSDVNSLSCFHSSPFCTWQANSRIHLCNSLGWLATNRLWSKSPWFVLLGWQATLSPLLMLLIESWQHSCLWLCLWCEVSMTWCEHNDPVFISFCTLLVLTSAHSSNCLLIQSACCTQNVLNSVAKISNSAIILCVAKYYGCWAISESVPFSCWISHLSCWHLFVAFRKSQFWFLAQRLVFLFECFTSAPSCKCCI
jgi:hypothetical protein